MPPTLPSKRKQAVVRLIWACVCLSKSDNVNNDFSSVCQLACGGIVRGHRMSIFIIFFSITMFCNLWPHQQIPSLQLMYIIGTVVRLWPHVTDQNSSAYQPVHTGQ